MDCEVDGCEVPAMWALREQSGARRLVCSSHAVGLLVRDWSLRLVPIEAVRREAARAERLRVWAA